MSTLILHFGLTAAIHRFTILHDPIYADKLAALQKRFDRPERALRVVALGSSRTGFGFDARLLDELANQEGPTRTASFNFGCPGAGPILEHIYLKRMLAAGVVPDLLILEVLPFSLAREKLGPFELRHVSPMRFRSNEVEAVLRFGFPEDYVSAMRRDIWLNPWQGLRAPIRGRFMPKWVPAKLRVDFEALTDEAGTMKPLAPAPTAAAQQQRIDAIWKSLQATFTDMELGGPALDALRETLELCAAREIPTIVLLMPETTTLRSWYPETALSEIARIIPAWCRELNIELVDARAWIGDQHFFDAHHVDAVGARTFTTRLAREIVLPRLK